MKSKNCIVILPTHKNKKSGIEEAMDDIRHGRVTEYKDADEMFEKLGIWTCADFNQYWFS